jgi:hypothetical protein
MDERMTLGEMLDRYPAEWILAEDPELDDELEIQRGRVVWHSKDRDEVYQKAVELRLKHTAFIYTGEIPEGTAVIL